MDCDQLNKDISLLRASKDAFQKSFDSANANLRGGIELRRLQKEAMESGNTLLLKYFEDFEKQYPDKWFRKFGEFEEPSEDELDFLSTEGSRRATHHDFSASNLDEALDRCLRNASGVVSNLESTFSLEGIFQTGEHSWNQAGIFEALGVGDEILVVGPFDGEPTEDIRVYHPSSDSQINKDEWYEFSIEKKKYTKEPRTLTRLDDNRVLVGCTGGGIAVIVKRNDGSWGVLEDKRWTPNPEEPLATVPKAFKLESGRLGLYDKFFDKMCVIEAKKNLNKLKRALGLNDNSERELY